MFDQYEIDVEMTKHRHSYINSGITKKLIELDLAFYDRTDKGYKSNVIFSKKNGTRFLTLLIRSCLSLFDDDFVIFQLLDKDFQVWIPTSLRK